MRSKSEYVECHVHWTRAATMLFSHERRFLYHFTAVRVPIMSEESIYKVIELVGVSPKSFEDAVKNVITETSKHLRDIRVAEVIQQDVRIENNKIAAYRVRVKLSFKYEKE